MAIVQGPCESFLSELLQAIHDFSVDTFKIALYSSSASLGSQTTAYSTTNEVAGAGYTAGGAILTPTLSSDRQNGKFVALVDFADASWPASTITARGALIYNSSKANRAVWVLNFGSDRVSSASTFPIVFPTPDFLNGIIRLGNS